MYLYKDFKGEQPKVPEIDFSEYINSFAFFRYIHSDNRSAFQCDDEKELKIRADFAASVVAQLFDRRANDDIIVKGLHCCRDILLAKDYTETPLSRIHDHAITNTDIDHIILVAGCQTDEILKSRVDAAIRLIRTLRTDVEIVFVGGAPERDKVKIRDESTRMMSVLENRIQQGLLTEHELVRLKSRKIVSESTSQNTGQNIEHFFKEGFLSSDKQYFLYLVSSTFHLLRLVNDCEKYFKKPEYKNNVHRLILFGADDINSPSVTAKSGRYIKLMFFDIFRHFMNEPKFMQE